MIAAGERTGSVRPAKLFSSQPPHPMSQILPLSMSEADIGVHCTPGAKHWRFRPRGESGLTGPARALPRTLGARRSLGRPAAGRRSHLGGVLFAG